MTFFFLLSVHARLSKTSMDLFGASSHSGLFAVGRAKLNQCLGGLPLTLRSDLNDIKRVHQTGK